MYSSSLFQSPGTFRETQNTLDMITTHFIELLRLKSKELYDHSVRVANYAGATAVACVMLLISFILLLIINGLQAWGRRRYGGAA